MNQHVRNSLAIVIADPGALWHCLRPTKSAVRESHCTIIQASMNTETRHIPMPPTAKHPTEYDLPLKDRVLVVIGSNGSGKTRFGAWLDVRDIRLHHRVSAHRSLVFP